MYLLKSLPLLLCLSITLLLSCRKKNPIPSIVNYSFTNSTPRRVTFDMYSTGDDYNNYTNRMAQYIIEPGTTTTLPLETLKDFWIDWYSNGYTYNNWVDSAHVFSSSFRPVPMPHIKVAIADDHFNIASSARDTSRSVLLNGNGTSSTWKANVTGIPQQNGTHTFTFRRDFKCEYTFAPVTGGATTELLSFYVANNQYPAFYTNLSENNNSFATLAFNTYFGSTQYTGRDTLVLQFYYSSSYRFAAVRQ